MIADRGQVRRARPDRAAPSPPVSPAPAATNEVGANSWKASAFQPVKAAAKILGISNTSIYRLGEDGQLTLRRVAGRVVVETLGIEALVANAPKWTSSGKGAAARAAYRASRAVA